MLGKSKPTGDSGQPGTTRCWEPGRGADGGVNGKLCLCLAAALLGPQQGSCEDCGPTVVQEGGELEDLDVECGEQRHVRTFRDAMHVTISNYKDLQRGTGAVSGCFPSLAQIPLGQLYSHTYRERGTGNCSSS